MRIAQAILGRVVWMASKQKRYCYLIYYSEHIRTINLMFSNWSLDELHHVHSGGTDATEMLTEVYRLLKEDENYMGADVLWISDFIVPDVTTTLLKQMKDFQKADTRFYGYQIGDRDSVWTVRMDKMYHCLCSQSKKI